MGERLKAPDITHRQQCYNARDKYYECITKQNNSDTTPCDELKKVYHSSCLPSWVKYFDQKRVYEEYKRKLHEEGYQETK